jgi:hypothetical protein
MLKPGDLVRVLAGWNRQTTARVLHVSAPSVKLVDYSGHIFYMRCRNVEQVNAHRPTVAGKLF